MKHSALVRAAMKSGLNTEQANWLETMAVYAAQGWTWHLPEGSGIQLATKRANAVKHPNGKDAEELLALKEGRPSRWGMAFFHRPTYCVVVPEVCLRAKAKRLPSSCSTGEAS